MTRKKIRENDEWGVSKNGYVAGGNFDDDPTLNKFSVKNYQKMKEMGKLQSVPMSQFLEKNSVFSEMGSYDYVAENTSRKGKSEMKVMKSVQSIGK
jgi:hypothetical protein